MKLGDLRKQPELYAPMGHPDVATKVVLGALVMAVKMVPHPTLRFTFNPEYGYGHLSSTRNAIFHKGTLKRVLNPTEGSPFLPLSVLAGLSKECYLWLGSEVAYLEKGIKKRSREELICWSENELKVDFSLDPKLFPSRTLRWDLIMAGLREAAKGSESHITVITESRIDPIR